MTSDQRSDNAVQNGHLPQQDANQPGRPAFSADPTLKYWVAGISVIIILLGIFHAEVNPWLQYDRFQIAQGQWWRLVTCHIVHLSVGHMVLDLSGFVLCCYFFADLFTPRLLALWFVVSAPVVGVMFYVFNPDLGTYVGLSGILHGLLILGLVLGFRTTPVLHSVVLALVAGRITWEHMPGYDINYMRPYIGGSVFVDAHLYGAIVGLLLALAILAWRRWRASGNPD